LPAISNPIANANEAFVHGKNSRRGARREACVVGAVTVRVAVPELVRDEGETLHVVPGRRLDTLHERAIVPVNPLMADTVRAEVPTLAVAPAINDSAVGEAAS
jgi:hypothetical protein